MKKSMKLMMMCVLVEAEDTDGTISAIDEAIGFSGVVHAPLYLACVDAKPAFAQLIEQCEPEAKLSVLMQASEVPIPFGVQYKVVDTQHGGLASNTAGVQTASFSVRDQVAVKGTEPTEMTLYLARTASGVVADLSGENAEDVIASASATFADVKMKAEVHA